MVPVSARVVVRRDRLFFCARALLLTGLLFAGIPASVQAQYFDSGVLPDTFNDQNTSGVVFLGKRDGLLGPYHYTNYFGPYLHIRHIAGDGPGYEDNGWTSVGLFAPKKFLSGVLFSEGRLAVDDLGELLGSVGSGYRHFVPRWNRVFGGSVWYDVDGGHNGTFTQVAANLETRGEYWDLFANFYLPVDQDDKRFHRTATPTGLAIPSFQGNNVRINMPNLIVEQFESAMKGVDVEIGGPLPVVGKWGIRAYGGWYHYEKDNFTDINGGRFRVQAELTDSLTGQFMLTNDNHFDTSVIFGITWTIPGSGVNRGATRMPTGIIRSTNAVVRAQSPDNGFSESQRFRMFQMTQRSDRVFIRESTRRSMEDVFVIATDPDTGQPFIVFHADSREAAGGDGSFERPFDTLVATQADTGPGGTILVHAGSIFNNPANNFIRLQPNQQFFGEGIARFLDTREAGLIAFPPSGRTGPLPLIDGAPANAIELASGVEVSGFTITNSGGAAIFVDGALTPTGTADVNNTTITGGMFGVDVQGAAGTLNFATTTSINNTTGVAFNVGGATSAQINFTGNINNTAGRAVDINNLLAGARVDFGGMVNDNGGTGIRVMNSAGNIIFADANLTIPTGTAVSLTNNPLATIRFNELDITTLAGAGLVATDSGTVIVSDGNIDATGGPAIFVNPTLIGMRFSNITSTNSPTTGIHLDRVSGRLDIAATAAINAPVGNGIEFIDSSADFTIATLNINNSGGNALFLNDTSGAAPDTLTGRFSVGGGLVQQTMNGRDTFLMNGGSAAVDFGANINHGVAVVNNSAMVNIMNTTTGTANFTGTLVANDGTGLQLSNVASNINFTGTTTLNGGDAGIDILGNSSGTFTFGGNTSIINPTNEAFVINGNGANNPRITYSGTIQNNANRAISIRNTVFGANNITFDSAAADAIQDTGTGIFLDNVGQTVSFVADAELTGTEGIDIDGGSGTFTFTDTDINVNGVALDVNGGTASVNFQSGNSITQASNSAAVNVTNHATGTLDFNGNVTAINGTGLQFSNADGTYRFDGTTTLNGGDAGIDIILGSNGTFTFTNTTITDPIGPAFRSDASGATVNYNGGSISKTNVGRAIDITGATGGTITFGPNVDISAQNLSNGINIVTATAAHTVNFNGSVDIGTTTSLLGDIGVNINNNAQASTITFADLDINTTGNTGLSAMNGGSLAITTGTVNTTNATGIMLDGINSNGSTFVNVTVTNAAAANNGLDFNNVTGTFNVTGATTVSGGMGQHGIEIDGGSAVFTFGATTITDSVLNAIDVADTTGGSVTFASTTLSNLTANGIRLTDNFGNFIVNGGTITVGAMTTGILSSNNNTNGDVTINGVTIQGGAAGINISGAGTSTFQALINNTTIGTTTLPLDGVLLSNTGTETISATLTSNTIVATNDGLNAMTAMGATMSLNIGTNNILGVAGTGVGNNISPDYFFNNLGTLNLGVTTATTAFNAVIPDNPTIIVELQNFMNTTGVGAPPVVGLLGNTLTAFDPTAILVP